jgi:transcriptional regulator with XRE-family HTH domain
MMADMLTHSGMPKKPDREAGRFGAAIKQRREELGLSQQQLADRTGVPQNIISNMENSSAKPNVFRAAIFAEALECGLEDMLAWARATPSPAKAGGGGKQSRSTRPSMDPELPGFAKRVTEVLDRIDDRVRGIDHRLAAVEAKLAPGAARKAARK